MKIVEYLLEWGHILWDDFLMSLLVSVRIHCGVDRLEEEDASNYLRAFSDVRHLKILILIYLFGDSFFGPKFLFPFSTSLLSLTPIPSFFRSLSLSSSQMSVINVSLDTKQRILSSLHRPCDLKSNISNRLGSISIKVSPYFPKVIESPHNQWGYFLQTKRDALASRKMDVPAAEFLIVAEEVAEEYVDLLEFCRSGSRKSAAFEACVTALIADLKSQLSRWESDNPTVVPEIEMSFRNVPNSPFTEALLKEDYSHFIETDLIRSMRQIQEVSR